ncbi:MAG: hypothetical protein AB7O26_06485 [Planctomycetaceae bacterium]
MFRWMTLGVVPAFIVGALYWQLQPDFTPARAAAAPIEPVPAPQTRAEVERRPTSLDDKCFRRGTAISEKLGEGCRILVRTPFVLAGDLREAELERHYRETILTTARALFVSYFDTEPHEPITILICSADESYQKYAQLLDGNPRVAYSGYYERGDRRVVINAATGNGTLAHELTHALAHFDFPEMPEWFDEGLASLHEQSEFSDDGLRIVGQSNWRLRFLVPAIRNGELQPLESLLQAQRVRSEEQAVDYAQARYLCLYLQQKNMLVPFYRKFRESADVDPTGRRALCRLFGVDSINEVDRDFQKWALSLSRVGL